MASVHKRPNSPYWWARYPLPDGRWVFRSTRMKDRSQAQKYAGGLHEIVKRGTLTEVQVRKSLKEIFEMINPGQHLASSSVRLFLDRWVQRKKAEVAASTLSSYVDSFRQFLTFLGPKADQDLAHLTRQDVIDYRTQRLAEVSVSTARGSLKKLNVALNDARREGLILANPGEGLTRLKADKTKVEARPFTDEEVRTLLKHADGEWEGMILFAYYTGQRLADVATMAWKNLDLDKGEFYLFETAKTGRASANPLARPLWNYLAELRKKNKGEFVFPECCSFVKRTGRSAVLSNQFKVIMAEAGLVEKTAVSHKKKAGGATGRRVRSEISFHSFRHGMTTNLKKYGVAQAVVMEIVGHDSKQVSQVYTHVDGASIRTALDKLPDLLGKPTKKGKK